MPTLIAQDELTNASRLAEKLKRANDLELQVLRDRQWRSYPQTLSYAVLTSVLGDYSVKHLMSKDIFPILSLESDKISVKYAETIDKLHRKIYTSIKIGRFLRKFFYDFSDYEIQELSKKLLGLLAESNGYRLTLSLPVLDDLSNRKIISDYWKEIYQTGLYADPVGKSFVSCMTRLVAVGAYACPQVSDRLLLLAVLLDSEDIPVSRTIVIGNGSISGYLRIYSSSAAAQARMTAELQDLGIRSVNSLDGYRIYSECDYSGFPYIDGYHQGVDTTERPYIYEITGYDGDYGTCDNLDGSITLADSMICSCCNERVSEDDGSFTEHGDEFICNECIDNEYYIFAEYATRYGTETTLVSKDEAIDIKGRWYLDQAESLTQLGFINIDGEWYDSDDVTFCSSCDEYCHNDDLLTLDESLYPYLDQNERYYPDWSNEITTTNLGRVALKSDLLAIGGNRYHPWETLINPNKIFNDNKTGHTVLDAQIIKLIDQIRIDSLEAYTEDHWLFEIVDFEAAAPLKKYNQLALF